MPGKIAMFLVLLLAAGVDPGLPAEPILPAQPVPLPGGGAGIGFDDLFFSPTLKKLVVPAGRSGKLDLVDPLSAQVAAIEGFTSKDKFGGGHGEGTTSADEGRGLIFANDRTSNSLVVVEAASLSLVAREPTPTIGRDSPS